MALFTAETAVQAARISVETRKRMAIAVRERAKELTEIALSGKIAEITTDNYLQSRLTRVRGQLDKLDAMMVEETDPQKLDRIASASARLSELERQLSNRPLPGSLKPRQEPAKRQREALAPMPVAPVVVPPEPPKVIPPVVSCGPENG